MICKWFNLVNNMIWSDRRNAASHKNDSYSYVGKAVLCGDKNMIIANPSVGKDTRGCINFSKKKKDKIKGSSIVSVN